MSHKRVKKLNQLKFKPIINPNHAKIYRWLLDAGYTVTYLAKCFNVHKPQLSALFMNQHKITVHQVTLCILLLKGIKTPSEIINSLYMLNEGQQLDKDLSNIYDHIQLPDPGETPIFRED